MKTPNIHKILSRYFKRIQPPYKSVIKDFEPEKLHDFRQKIKRLSAFLWLLSGKKPGGALKLNKSLRHFYQSVGKVRNLQLHQQRIKTLCKQARVSLPLYYLQSLQQAETRETNVAHEAGQYVNLKSFFHKLRKAAPKRLKSTLLKDFLALNFPVFIDLLKKPVPDENDLHEIRKFLQCFLHVWPWIKKDLRVEFPTADFNKKTCAKLAAKIGDFLDSCVSLRFFEGSYAVISANIEEINILHSLQAHFFAGRQARYNDIGKVLTTLSANRESSTRGRLLSSAPVLELKTSV